MPEKNTYLGAMLAALLLQVATSTAAAQPNPSTWGVFESICSAQFVPGSDNTFSCARGPRDVVAWYSKPSNKKDADNTYPFYNAQVNFDLSDYCLERVRRQHPQTPPEWSRGNCYVLVRYYEAGDDNAAPARDWFLVGDPIETGFRNGIELRVDPQDLVCQCEYLDNNG